MQLQRAMAAEAEAAREARAKVPIVIERKRVKLNLVHNVFLKYNTPYWPFGISDTNNSTSFTLCTLATLGLWLWYMGSSISSGPSL